MTDMNGLVPWLARTPMGLPLRSRTGGVAMKVKEFTSEVQTKPLAFTHRSGTVIGAARAASCPSTKVMGR
jgi:hypothetical protein